MLRVFLAVPKLKLGGANVAPADDPVVAGAVVVEQVPNGFGGVVAAPIAKELMQAILPATSK